MITLLRWSIFRALLHARLDPQNSQRLMHIADNALYIPHELFVDYQTDAVKTLAKH